MAKFGVGSSITDASLKRFKDKANTGDCLPCDRIKGFHVYMNKHRENTCYRFRPSSSHVSRSPIVIAKVTDMKTQQAAEIAIAAIQAINNGDDHRALIARMVKNRLSPHLIPTKDQMIYLGNFFDEVYVPTKERENGRGTKTHNNSIRKHWGHLFDRRMDKLTVADIRSWQAERVEEGLKHNTIKQYYGLLRSVLNFAVELSYEIGGEYEGLLPEVPFKTTPLSKPTKEQREREINQQRADALSKRRILDKEEVLFIERAMYRYAQERVDQRERSLTHSNKRHLPSISNLTFPNWILPFFYIAYYTGMRPGDVFDLSWEDIHNGSIRKVLNKTKNRSKPFVSEIPVTMDKMTLRYSLQEVLDIWHEQQGEPDKGFLFTQPRDPSKPMSEKGYAKAWKKIKGYAGADLDMYCFRHNFISTLVAKGENLSKIARLAGHTSVKMIEKHYAHHSPKDMRDAMGYL